MPLVTRQANQGNLFVEPDEPQTWSNGDLWVESDTADVFVNDSGTAEDVGIRAALVYG